MTFQNLEQLLDAFEQVALDTRRAHVTDLLLSDLDDCHDEDLADMLDRDRERYDAELQQWRVKARHQLAKLPLVFPLTVDFERRPSFTNADGGRILPHRESRHPN